MTACCQAKKGIEQYRLPATALGRGRQLRTALFLLGGCRMVNRLGQSGEEKCDAQSPRCLQDFSTWKFSDQYAIRALSRSGGVTQSKSAVGYTLDISGGGVCILLDDQIPLGILCPIRFEMTANGKVDVVTALARTVYGVFASQGGFLVGLKFKQDDPKRTALIKVLAGKKPVGESRKKAAAPETVQETSAE